LEHFELFDPSSSLIGGVYMSPINRIPGLNVTEHGIPVEINDSEPESSQIPRTSKDLKYKIVYKLYLILIYVLQLLMPLV